MAIILFRKGTGEPVKVGEFGFEHSVASGNYFLSKEEAIDIMEPIKVDLGTHDNNVPITKKKLCFVDQVSGLCFDHQGQPPPQTKNSQEQASKEPPLEDGDKKKRKYTRKATDNQ